MSLKPAEHEVGRLTVPVEYYSQKLILRNVGDSETLWERKHE